MSAGVAPEPWLTPARDYPKAPPGVCILVVDCDPTSLMVVSGMLKALEYQVYTVNRAVNALTMTMHEDSGIDLVLAELHMPDMYGFDLLDQINRRTRVPVVMMSADASEEAMVGSLDRGAEYYIIKPVEMEHMADLWQYVYNRRDRLRREAERREREVSTVRDVESYGEEEEDDSDEDEDYEEDEEKEESEDDDDTTMSDAEDGDEESAKEEDTGKIEKDREEAEQIPPPIPETKANLTSVTTSLIAETPKPKAAGGGSVMSTDPIEGEAKTPPPGEVESGCEAEDNEGGFGKGNGGDVVAPPKQGF